jgi:hypothetical protein
MEELIIEADKIQAYLEIECSNNSTELQVRISCLMVYLARSGEMLARAKKILRAKKSNEIHNTILNIAKEAHLSASIQNALLDSICENESFLVDKLDRMNATITHQIDGLRSLLSYEKESMRLNKTGY